MSLKTIHIDGGNHIEIRNEANKLHCLDGPAIKNLEINFWYKNGKLHRECDPAVTRHNPEHNTPKYEWWINGKPHREDGPAVVYKDGRKEWWVYGKRHRLYGPAIIYEDLSEEWWQDGKLHREDGPAIIKREFGKTVVGETWYRDGRKVSPPVPKFSGTIKRIKNYTSKDIFLKLKNENIIELKQSSISSTLILYEDPEDHETNFGEIKIKKMEVKMNNLPDPEEGILLIVDYPLFCTHLDRMDLVFLGESYTDLYRKSKVYTSICSAQRKKSE